MSPSASSSPSPPSATSVQAQLLGSSRLRKPEATAATELARLFSESGAHGMFFSAPWHLGLLKQAAEAVAAEGLSVAALQVPLAREPLPVDKRLPHWASPDDPEERLAAIKLADDGITAASSLGASWALLEAFSFRLKAPAQAFVRAVAERRLEPDGSPFPAAQPLMEAAREERKRREPRLADGARHALERLAEVAERRRLTLALAHGVGPWQFPSPKELELLLSEFRGAPLCRAYLPARLDVLSALGLLTDERRGTLSKAPFVVASDAIGLQDDLLPGLGPSNVNHLLRSTDDKPPSVVVVTGRSDSRPDEVRQAFARLERLSLP